MISTAREKIKAKIAALRNKTSGAGCTEAEAMAAAELAAKLMAEHGLSDIEIEMAEASIKEKTVTATWRSQLAGTIAYCTNSRAVLASGSWVFIGLDPGPDIAVYLYQICSRATVGAIKEFKNASIYRRRRSLRTKKQAVADFTLAMVNRVMIRLLELFGPTISKISSLRAEDAKTSRFGETKALTLKSHEFRYDEAIDLGVRSGDKVPLNRGLGSSAAPLAITGARS